MHPSVHLITSAYIRKKKNLGSESYDPTDPFITTRNLVVDGRTFIPAIPQTKQQGIYVFCSEVALLKEKSHRKPKSKKSPRSPNLEAAIECLRVAISQVYIDLHSNSSYVTWMCFTDNWEPKGGSPLGIRSVLRAITLRVRAVELNEYNDNFSI